MERHVPLASITASVDDRSTAAVPQFKEANNIQHAWMPQTENALAFVISNGASAFVATAAYQTQTSVFTVFNHLPAGADAQFVGVVRRGGDGAGHLGMHGRGTADGPNNHTVVVTGLVTIPGVHGAVTAGQTLYWHMPKTDAPTTLLPLVSSRQPATGEKGGKVGVALSQKNGQPGSVVVKI